MKYLVIFLLPLSTYALEIGDQVIGIETGPTLDKGEIATVIQLGSTSFETSAGWIGYHSGGVRWELYHNQYVAELIGFATGVILFGCFALGFNFKFW